MKAGVMGWPVDHSLSPRLHGYWLEQAGLEGSYVPLAVEPDQLGRALKSLVDQGFTGVNLTVPHKEAALCHVDRLDDVARRVGAINTVLIHNNGTLEGLNTDVYGLTQNLLTGGVAPGPRPAVILGAGGAARAAAAALLAMGFSDLRFLNRTTARAEIIAKDFGGTVFAWNDQRALSDCTLLINATSCGMRGQAELELELARLPADAVVTDMVYVPIETGLLRRARQEGHPVIDGLGMLLWQAKPAFRLFYGVDPDVTPGLRDHILKDLT